MTNIAEALKAWTHHTYHREGKTDLATIRREAIRRAHDKRFPENTVIHLHAREDIVDWPSCISIHEHEYVQTED